MANVHTTLTSLFQDIADKIKIKTGSTDKIIADNFPTAIEGITTVSEATADDTATAADLALGATAHVKGAKITGTLPVTAKSDSYGFTYSGLATSSVSGTFLLNSLAPKDVIMKNGAIAATYVKYTDLNTFLGLTADKVKRGAVIGNITGTYTSDATATANDILEGKTAYVKGQKVTGGVSDINCTLYTYETGKELIENTAYTYGDISTDPAISRCANSDRIFLKTDKKHVSYTDDFKNWIKCSFSGTFSTFSTIGFPTFFAEKYVGLFYLDNSICYLKELTDDNTFETIKNYNQEYMIKRFIFQEKLYFVAKKNTSISLYIWDENFFEETKEIELSFAGTLKFCEVIGNVLYFYILSADNNSYIYVNGYDLVNDIFVLENYKLIFDDVINGNFAYEGVINEKIIVSLNYGIGCIENGVNFKYINNSYTFNNNSIFLPFTKNSFLINTFNTNIKYYLMYLSNDKFYIKQVNLLQSDFIDVTGFIDARKICFDYRVGAYAVKKSKENLEDETYNFYIEYTKNIFNPITVFNNFNFDIVRE